MKLEKCVAIVTGGASGLGEAAVRRIIGKGGKAAIFDLTEEKGRELVHELGEAVAFYRVNVAEETEVVQALDAVEKQWGSTTLLVNCAGIGTAAKLLSRKGVHPLALFKKTLDVNLAGTFNLIRLVSERMTANEPGPEGERGVIINTASIAAYEGQIGQIAYSASKAGIVGMTLPLARELAAYGIRVMTIAPGFIETPLFATLPQEVYDSLVATTVYPKRLGKSTEFAQLVEQIAENPLLNGSTIRLDGAIRMQAH